MLVEHRFTLPGLPGARAMPKWQRQLQQYENTTSSERTRFEAIVSQAGHELRALTKLAQSGARRVVVDQQTALCAKLLARIERHQTGDDAALLPAITDAQLLAALQKRTDRRLAAEKEIADPVRNERQLELNRLVQSAERDVDLCRKIAVELTHDARWSQQLGKRMKATAIELLAILEESTDLDVTMPPSVAQWLARAKELIENPPPDRRRRKKTTNTAANTNNEDKDNDNG